MVSIFDLQLFRRMTYLNKSCIDEESVERSVQGKALAAQVNKTLFLLNPFPCVTALSNVKSLSSAMFHHVALCPLHNIYNVLSCSDNFLYHFLCVATNIYQD